MKPYFTFKINLSIIHWNWNKSKCPSSEMVQQKIKGEGRTKLQLKFNQSSSSEELLN